MDRNLLQRYTGRDEAAPDDGDAVEDLGCFGWLRGARERAPMLRLWKRTGECLAISYSWIERINYDPSVGIVIHMGSTAVTLHGRNLNRAERPQVRLFEGLTRQRVPWVKEEDADPAFIPSREACVVDKLSW
ncbi:MAG: hypothetical protein GC161_07680 [Planctomycetaceae bacterium]|nr:hypothetical protein [Planctomycetaceae bacterium]